MRVSVKAYLGCSCDHSLQVGQNNPASALQPLLTCQSLDSRCQTFHPTIPTSRYSCKMLINLYLIFVNLTASVWLCADVCLLRPS